MLAKIVGTLVALSVLGLLFRRLERRWPARTLPRRTFRESLTDVLHWIVTPVVAQLAATATLIVSVIVTAIVSFGTVRLDRMRGGASAALPAARWLAQQHGVVQVVGVLLIGDLVGYWVHRLFHARRLWSIHAVHHSATRMDWLSTARNHPLQDAVGVILQAVPLILLGFDGRVVAMFGPFLLLYGVLLHANVSWSFGPLRYVFASPRFHRWHHAADREAQGRNFAGLFPFIDVCFGTYYMPRDRLPAAFGTGDPAFPKGWFGQMAYPFRRMRGPAHLARAESTR